MEVLFLNFDILLSYFTIEFPWFHASKIFLLQDQNKK